MYRNTECEALQYASVVVTAYGKLSSSLVLFELRLQKFYLVNVSYRIIYHSRIVTAQVTDPVWRATMRVRFKTY